jgi:hypothetical protein
VWLTSNDFFFSFCLFIEKLTSSKKEKESGQVKLSTNAHV